MKHYKQNLNDFLDTNQLKIDEKCKTDPNYINKLYKNNIENEAKNLFHSLDKTKRKELSKLRKQEKKFFLHPPMQRRSGLPFRGRKSRKAQGRAQVPHTLRTTPPDLPHPLPGKGPHLNRRIGRRPNVSSRGNGWRGSTAYGTPSATSATRPSPRTPSSTLRGCPSPWWPPYAGRRNRKRRAGPTLWRGARRRRC